MRIPCTVCGTEVDRTPVAVRRAGGKAFCSTPCRTAYRKQHPPKPPSTKGVRKSEWVVRTCETCGKEVERRAREDRPELPAFCSRACSNVRGRGGRPVRHQIGDRRTTAGGYVEVYVGKQPGRTSCWMAEHRLVMVGVLGRELAPQENVHHVNGLKADNRPENLELWVSQQPKGQRVADLVAFAQEILHQHGG